MLPSASAYLDTLGSHDLLKLVYRDHIALKHASRKRLAAEMSETNKQLESSSSKQKRTDVSLQNNGDSEKQGKAIDVLSKMLTRYLMAVPLFQFSKFQCMTYEYEFEKIVS